MLKKYFKAICLFFLKNTADVISNRPFCFVYSVCGNPLTLMDITGDGEDIIERVDLSIRSSQLYGFLENYLDKREFEIIKYRYGLYGCKALTQREVAKKLNISRSYVYRIAYCK